MMKRVFALSALCLAVLATSLRADTYPALFDVRGVSEGDVLNVRDLPSATGSVVGSLKHDATQVEVVEVQGNWGRVNVAEQSGWASLRYLERIAGSALPQARAVTCFGTEPFWSLSAAPGSGGVFSTPERREAGLGFGPVMTAAGRYSPFALTGAGPDGEARITVVIQPGICSDGMSDQLFGLEGSVVREGATTQLLSGCCTLSVQGR